MDFIFICPLPFEFRLKCDLLFWNLSYRISNKKRSVTFKSTKLTKEIKIHQEYRKIRAIKIKNSLPFLEIGVWRLHFECHYEFYNHNFSSCGNSFLILQSSRFNLGLIKIDQNREIFDELLDTNQNASKLIHDSKRPCWVTQCWVISETFRLSSVA